MRKIMVGAIAAVAVVVFFLITTKAGRDIDAATQRFMLFYAGVFALVGLTGSVLAGLLATDRIFMTPGHRVMAQAVHRAMSFGALAFLIVHIVTEILAQRAHVIDAFVPFLSPYRTFYIGLGTIASDLILAIVVTSILRRRFTAQGAQWRWRAIHYSAYVAFVFGVLHGLLGGRAAKPYVDWSYGFAIALAALGLAIRFLAISLRSKEHLSGPPGADRSPARSPQLHAAALNLAQAQLGGNPVQVLPPALAARATAAGRPGLDAWAALPPAQAWSPLSGPQPALISPSASEPPWAYAAQAAADNYREPGVMPLGAPAYAASPYADDRANLRARPYIPADSPGASRAAPAAPVPVTSTARQPHYEPGYDGPPRFEGAPRGHGGIPQDGLSSYPYDPRGSRPPQPGALPPAGYEGASGPRRAIAGPASPGTGPQPRFGTGPASPGTGPLPRFGSGPARPGTGAFPQLGSGPMARPSTGPMPRADSGPMPRLGPARPGTGPMPRADTGSFPRIDPGPMARPGAGSPPRADTGSMPRIDTGSFPRADSGPMPRMDPAPGGRSGSGPWPRPGTGPMPRPATGPMPRYGTGPMPRPDTGPMPRPDTGFRPQPGTDPRTRIRREPDPLSDPNWVVPDDPGRPPRHARGPASRPGAAAPAARPDTGPIPRMGSGPRTGPLPRATRPANADDPRYREAPGPYGGNEWQ